MSTSYQHVVYFKSEQRQEQLEAELTQVWKDLSFENKMVVVQPSRVLPGKWMCTFKQEFGQWVGNAMHDHLKAHYSEVSGMEVIMS